jgi:LmbE family N-acetylglucosaminyl deacetylase
MIITSRDLPVPARALAVGAHPDDIEFGAGATLSRWAESGCDVSLLVCTDGSKGSWEPDTDLEKLIATRRAEQRDAATALGAAGEVVFLDRVDGDLVADRETTSEIARWIRVVRPDVLLGHDPWKRYRVHPDHRAAGVLVIDAMVAARDPHFFREHALDHHRPTALLLFEGHDPTHAESVRPSHVEAKIAALECHRSQFASTMSIGPDDTGSERESFRRGIRDRAATAGRVVGRSGAELFARVPTDR